MATKTPARKGKLPRQVSGVSRLCKLAGKHQAIGQKIAQLHKELADLIEELEDEHDARLLEAAIKRNGNKPLIPWDEAKKRLGLNF
jgi:hypothetical protein